MMKNIILKLFCLHKWNTHARKVYEHTDKEVVSGTESWYKPIVTDAEYSKTIEVLICEKCGKIETIEY